MPGHDWLSSTLRGLRAQAGLSGVAAARAVGISQPRISRIEKGVFVPTADEIQALCDLYHAPAATRRKLLAAVEDLRAEPRPSRALISRDSAYKMQQRIRRIEAATAEICVFEPILIPGLLQTRDYARAVFADGGDITGSDLEKSIEERMARAAILGDPGREFTFIIPEGALRWQATSPQVMAAQLDHIAALAGRLRIGVIPWTQPMTVFTVPGMTIFDRRTVSIGIRHHTTFITDPGDVADYVKLFDTLGAAAVTGPAAQAIITAQARAYRSLS
jgi:transcriptional regulator with XRE-family HTH domain